MCLTRRLRVRAWGTEGVRRVVSFAPRPSSALHAFGFAAREVLHSVSLSSRRDHNLCLSHDLSLLCKGAKLAHVRTSQLRVPLFSTRVLLLLHSSRHNCLENHSRGYAAFLRLHKQFVLLLSSLCVIAETQHLDRPICIPAKPTGMERDLPSSRPVIQAVGASVLLFHSSVDSFPA